MRRFGAQDGLPAGSGLAPRPRPGAGLFRIPQSAFRNRRGLTLIEMLVAVTILGVLASVALPLQHLSVKRVKELELRRDLRALRTAIDQFKLEYDKARGNARDAKAVFKGRASVDRSGYPLTLQELLETKILRRIPRDPMTPEGKWVIRSYSDNLDSSISDDKDVFDVRSASTAVALDGTTYDTW